MSKRSVPQAERRRAKKAALKRLQSRRFFNEFLRALKKAGLVGEEQNALVLLLVVVSRILVRPLNAFVKGHSSAGKNFLVKLILLLMPRSAIKEITSTSDQALSYSQSDFRHCVVYLQEQNEAAGAPEPMRQLISEGKLVRIAARPKPG
jgi:DNA primase